MRLLPESLETRVEPSILETVRRKMLATETTAVSQSESECSINDFLLHNWFKQQEVLRAHFQLQVLKQEDFSETNQQLMKILVDSEADFFELLNQRQQVNNRVKHDVLALERACLKGLPTESLKEKLLDETWKNFVSAVNDGVRLPIDNLLSELTNTSKRSVDGNVLPSCEDLQPVKALFWCKNEVNKQCARILQTENNISLATERQELDAKTASLAYISLLPFCGTEFEHLMCFINSALWALKAMQADKETGDDVALVQSVLQLMCALFPLHVSQFGSSLDAVKFYTARMLCAIAKQAGEITGFGVFAYIAYDAARNMTRNAPFLPFHKLPTVAVCEAETLRRCLVQLQLKCVQGLEDIVPQRRLLRKSDLVSRQFHTALANRTGSNLDELRNLTVATLLDEDDERQRFLRYLTDCPCLKYDADGWMRFGELSAVKRTDADTAMIDLRDQTIRLCDADSDAQYELTNDAAAILSEPIDRADPLLFVFLLTEGQASSSSMFGCRFSPACINGTELLSAMYQADSLLKQFDAGVEMNAQAPYACRPAQFPQLSGLPGELFSGEHKKQPHWGAVYILVEKAEYSWELCEHQLKLQVHDVKFTFENREAYQSTERTQQSATGQFMKRLTDNFDQLCEHFLPFAKLKAYCKLHVLRLLLLQHRQNLLQKSKGVAETDDFLRAAVTFLGGTNGIAYDSEHFLEKVLVNKSAPCIESKLGCSIRLSDATVQALESDYEKFTESFRQLMVQSEDVCTRNGRATSLTKVPWAPMPFRGGEAGGTYGGVSLTPQRIENRSASRQQETRSTVPTNSVTQQVETNRNASSSPSVYCFLKKETICGLMKDGLMQPFNSSDRFGVGQRFTGQGPRTEGEIMHSYRDAFADSANDRVEYYVRIRQDRLPGLKTFARTHVLLNETSSPLDLKKVGAEFYKRKLQSDEAPRTLTQNEK